MRGLAEVPFNVPASPDSSIIVMKCVTLLLFQEETKNWLKRHRRKIVSFFHSIKDNLWCQMGGTVDWGYGVQCLALDGTGWESILAQ